MLRYVLRSLVVIPIALLLVHFFGFTFGTIVGPMQAARNPLYVGERTSAPLLPSYLNSLERLSRLDLGILPGSPRQEPLAAVLGRATLASVGLLGISLALSVALGLGFGLLAVRSNPPRISTWLTTATTIGLATPTFFFGVLGISFVIIYLINAPGTPLLLPLEGFGWDSHLVLPVIALMLRPTAQVAQVTAGMMVAELGKPYVVTARSIGNTERRIARRHVLRNALPTVVATVAGSLRLMAGELILVETLFYWPGLGQLIGWALIPANSSVSPESALFLNPPLLALLLSIFAALFLLTNLAANVLIRALDPRLR